MTLIHPDWPEGGEHKNGYPFTIASTGKVKPWRSIEQQVADARLIADAPSLLKALERISNMTDIEADFDGFEAREIARTALNSDAPLSNPDQGGQ